MEIIQINRFSRLNNGNNVIFSKTDFVPQVLNSIRGNNQKTILISGNSDKCIDDNLANNIPANLVKWFCQNRLSDHEKLEAIPIGIDNCISCSVPNNGYVWQHSQEHHNFLNKEYNINPTKFLYGNFSLETNSARKTLVSICDKLEYVTLDTIGGHNQSNARPYNAYINNILKHRAVLCPQGEGMGDNHRIYEVLYLKRIPIVFNPYQYKYIHYNFPVVFCEDFSEIKDKKTLENRIDDVYNNVDWSKLDCQYWLDKIQQEIDKL